MRARDRRSRIPDMRRSRNVHQTGISLAQFHYNDKRSPFNGSASRSTHAIHAIDPVLIITYTQYYRIYLSNLKWVPFFLFFKKCKNITLDSLTHTQTHSRESRERWVVCTIHMRTHTYANTTLLNELRDREIRLSRRELWFAGFSRDVVIPANKIGELNSRRKRNASYTTKPSSKHWRGLLKNSISSERRRDCETRFRFDERKTPTDRTASECVYVWRVCCVVDVFGWQREREKTEINFGKWNEWAIARERLEN